MKDLNITQLPINCNFDYVFSRSLAGIGHHPFFFFQSYSQFRQSHSRFRQRHFRFRQRSSRFRQRPSRDQQRPSRFRHHPFERLHLDEAGHPSRTSTQSLVGHVVPAHPTSRKNGSRPRVNQARQWSSSIESGSARGVEEECWCSAGSSRQHNDYSFLWKIGELVWNKFIITWLSRVWIACVNHVNNHVIGHSSAFSKIE